MMGQGRISIFVTVEKGAHHKENTRAKKAPVLESAHTEHAHVEQKS